MPRGQLRSTDRSVSPRLDDPSAIWVRNEQRTVKRKRPLDADAVRCGSLPGTRSPPHRPSTAFGQAQGTTGPSRSKCCTRAQCRPARTAMRAPRVLWARVEAHPESVEHAQPRIAACHLIPPVHRRAGFLDCTKSVRAAIDLRPANRSSTAVANRVAATPRNACWYRSLHPRESGCRR